MVLHLKEASWVDRLIPLLYCLISTFYSIEYT